MNKAKRTTVIAGNWKMNKTPDEAQGLAQGVAEAFRDTDFEELGVKVMLCVPFLDLQAAMAAVKDTQIEVAAQNMHHEKSGPYTGEISAPMLRAIGVRNVLIGHSERRQYFGETDETVNKKLHAAMSADIKAIVCVGENLDQRESGQTTDILTTQTKAAFAEISAEEAAGIIVAYEPIWAIGTGRTASPEQANEGNGIIRRALAQMYDEAIAQSITIQYGGSMNAENAAALLAQPHVDGGLIGGASLDAGSFGAIIRAAMA